MKRRRTTPRPGLDDQRYRRNRQLLKRIGSHVCHWCRQPIDLQLTYPHPLSWSCDHRTPRAHLTPDDPRHWHIDFLLEAHFRCNSARGAKALRQATDGRLSTSIDW